MSDTSKIVIIIASGIVSKKFNVETNEYVTISNMMDIVGSVRNEFSDKNIEVVEYAAIDSSSADLDFFYDLAKFIQRKINSSQIKGVILIYGTDTMEILAYFLYRCIVNHNKPIIITGSVRETKDHDFDGRANLVNAIKQILDNQSSIYSNGVTVNFAGKIHSPAYIQKDHTFAIDPFSSGKLGIIGMMHVNKIVWMNVSKKATVIPLPNKLEQIPIIYAYPGANEDLLDAFMNENFKAIVVVGYGSGNVSDSLYLSIRKAIEYGLKIILVTNCKFGGINSEYGGIGGNQSLKDLGVIMANDLNAYQAMTVASLVIGNSMLKNGANLENYFNNKILMN